MDQVTQDTKGTEVILLLSDDIKATISRKAAMQSGLFETMLADDVDEVTPEIPILEVGKAAFDKVVEFLKHHENDPMMEIEKPLKTNDIVAIVGEWDAKFIDVEQELLFEIMKAANYLEIKTLLDLGMCKVACMVKGKEPAQVKELFGIDPNITPEEEKQVRDENSWIFNVDVPQTDAQ